MEDYVYVLDYLPKGRGDVPPFKRKPVVYGIGENQFTFLELIPRPDASFSVGERIYVGKDAEKRRKIEKIKGRVNYEDLTSTAHGELPYVLLDMVHHLEPRYIKFFNEASAISTRYHVLELLPGLGKKHMWEIIDARRDKEFDSFDDIKKRVKLMPDPEKAIIKRIMAELSGKEKHHLFVEQ